MKKNLIILSLIAIVAITPVLALAQPAVQIGSVTQLINRIQALAWQVFGIIAVICFIIAGILFLTSGGAPEKITAARSAFMWGVAGVVVGILAYSIIAIIQNVLGGGM